MIIRRIGLALSMLLLVAQAATAQGRLAVVREAEINASAADVWALVGKFGGLQDWHPAVKSTQLTGNGMTAGDVRLLTLGDGGQIKEVLKSLDDSKMQMVYEIMESPLPVSNYHSIISVQTTASGKARFSWTSTFDPKDVPDSDAVNAIAGIYEAGIAALKQRFP